MPTPFPLLTPRPHAEGADEAAPRWRLLRSPAATGAENMALDEALMARARRTGELLFRVYAWRTPTLSLGRHQTARGRYNVDAARARGIAFVRRPTGGRALLHYREITYSVAAPDAALGSLRESYARINRLLVAALGRLGIAAATAATAAPPPAPGVSPCFAEPVAGEIVVGGRKLVGSAQWRDRGALLQHGSILVDDDQPLASELLAEPAPSPPPAATLRALLGRAPDADEFAAALAAALGDSEAGPPRSIALDPGLRAAARALTPRYESDAWTWRR